MEIALASRHLLLLVVAIPFLIPFYWLVISAFKTNGDLTSLPPTMWPHPWTFANMQSAVGVAGFWDYVRNTAYITTFNVVATVASSAIIAYPFARLRFPAREIFPRTTAAATVLYGGPVRGWVTAVVRLRPAGAAGPVSRRAFRLRL